MLIAALAAAVVLQIYRLDLSLSVLFLCWGHNWFLLLVVTVVAVAAVAALTYPAQMHCVLFRALDLY